MTTTFETMSKIELKRNDHSNWNGNAKETGKTTTMAWRRQEGQWQWS